jgi:hypothetical protein
LLFKERELEKERKWKEHEDMLERERLRVRQEIEDDRLHLLDLINLHKQKKQKELVNQDNSISDSDDLTDNSVKIIGQSEANEYCKKNPFFLFFFFFFKLLQFYCKATLICLNNITTNNLLNIQKYV